MKRFSEQFHTKSQSETLSATEKQALRERVVSYMEYHPLPTKLQADKQTPAAKSPLLTDAFKTVSVPFSLIFKSSAVAAALVLVVVPFMAEQSVPGDALYAVKVQFNEEVRGTLTFDAYQKVEWETQRVNRRIAEARLLESEGRLTDEVKAEVAQAVRTHTQSAQREIQNLRELDAEEATLALIEFDSNLEAQSATLRADELEDGSESEPAMLASRMRTVNLIAQAVDESRAISGQPAASSTPSYAKLIARVEQNTTRMYELSNSLQALKPETKEHVARRIEDIDRSVEEAIALFPEQEHEARELLVDVLKRTQKLIVFMTYLEVSDTFDIEQLVPIELTDQEEVAQIKEYKEELAEKQMQIETILTGIEEIKNADFSQKMTTGAAEIATLAEKLEEASSFREIQTHAKQAIELADDLLVALEESSREVVEQPTEPKSETEQSTSTTASSSAQTSDADSSDSDVDSEETDSTSSATSTQTQPATSSPATSSATSTETE